MGRKETGDGEKRGALQTFAVRLGICLGACLLLALGIVLLVMTRKIERVFGQVSFDQILFHLTLPAETVDSGLVRRFLDFDWTLKSLIWGGVVAAALTLSLSLPWFYSLLSRVLRHFSEHPLRLPLLLSLLLMLAGLGLFCVKFNVIGSLLMSFQSSVVIDEHYASPALSEFRQVDASGRDLSDAEKPHLVLIVSESLETTFSRVELFGEDMLRELTSVAADGVQVKEHYEVYGSHYTIAALYSLLYGMPMLYFNSRFINSGSGNRNIFAGKSASILDVLDASGYSLLHLQGSSLKFANTAALFEHLPKMRALGLEDFSPDDYPTRQAWGLWDHDLFDIARRQLNVMAQEGRPFALTLQTIDTHVGNPPSPKAVRHYGDERDNIRCQSRLIAEFVQWIRSQDWGRKTVIVVVGDHCMMTSHLGNVDFADLRGRRVYNVLLNAQNHREMKPRQAAEFDFAPTILDALGFQWPGYSLGIGHSLYRETPTIIERIGVDNWNLEAKKSSKTYGKFIED